MAKALVLRTHAWGYELVQLLLDLLPDEKWGIDAAKAFQIITSDDDLLNKSNHAVIRLLHKQRFFMFVFPKLVENVSSQNINDSGNTSTHFLLFSVFVFCILLIDSHAIELPDCIIKYHRQCP